MSNMNIANEAQELDTASLDLVVGGAVMVPEATGSSTDIRRKQEQEDKLFSEEQVKLG